MPKHLASKLPYENTTIAAEYTKADIDGMLHEFCILDDQNNRVAQVTGIRWTDLPPNLPILEFMVEYQRDGVKKTVGIRLQPPLLTRKMRGKDKYGTRAMLNVKCPDQSMRLLYWYLKTKLEAVLFGLNDISQEFLNEVIVSLPEQKSTTVGNIVLNQLKESKIPQLEYQGHQE